MSVWESNSHQAFDYIINLNLKIMKRKLLFEFLQGEEKDYRIILDYEGDETIYSMEEYLNSSDNYSEVVEKFQCDFIKVNLYDAKTAIALAKAGAFSKETSLWIKSLIGFKK